MHPYTKCKIELVQHYVNRMPVYVREPKPYVFSILYSKSNSSIRSYFKTLELNVKTGVLAFGGQNQEDLEIHLSKVPEIDRVSINLSTEEIGKLHEWLCSFAELRDTIIPAVHGAQMWRARKPIELNISQVYRFLDTEWKSMHSKIQMLEENLSNMQSKAQMLEQKPAHAQLSAPRTSQAQNLYDVMY